MHLIADITGRYISIHTDINGRIDFLFLYFPCEHFNGGVQHFHIKIIPHHRHLPMLSLPHEIARSSDLKIPHGNFKPGPKLCKILQCS